MRQHVRSPVLMCTEAPLLFLIAFLLLLLLLPLPLLSLSLSVIVAADGDDKSDNYGKSGGDAGNNSADLDDIKQ